MFNRDDFKPSTISSLEEEDAKVDKMLGKGGYSEYLTLKQGKNYIRIFPAHPTTGSIPSLFAEPRVVTSLPIFQEERDDKGAVVMENGHPKKVEKNKNIFNSKVHGGLSFDLVEEYIERVKSKAEKLFPGSTNVKAKSDYLKFIYGVFIKKGNPGNIFGITYQSKWVMYVKRFNAANPNEVERGRVEIGKAIKNRLNELAAIEASAQAIQVDPYTHPDTGVSIVIDYNQNASQASDYYKTELYMPRDGREITLFPLTDEDLSWLMEQESLHSQFRNAFTRKDLNFQIEGLENLDRKTGYDIFSDESFLIKIEEAIKLVPDTKTQEKKETATVQQKQPEPEVVTQKAPEVQPEPEPVKAETPAPPAVTEPPVTTASETTSISPAERLQIMRAKLLGGSGQ